MKRKKIKWSWLKCARADRWHAADQNGNHANSNVGHNPRKMGCCYQKTWWCVPIPISQIVDHWRGLYLNCYSMYSKVDFKVVLKISRSRIKISNRNFSQKTNGWFFFREKLWLDNFVSRSTDLWHKMKFWVLFDQKIIRFLNFKYLPNLLEYR